MHPTKKRYEFGAALGDRVIGQLNLAAEISAANPEGAGRTREDGKAIRATQGMVRTKCETPGIAVGEPDASDLMVVGGDPRGERAFGNLRFVGRERLRGNRAGKAQPHRRLSITTALTNHRRNHDDGDHEKAEDGKSSFHERRGGG